MEGGSHHGWSEGTYSYVYLVHRHILMRSPFSAMTLSSFTLQHREVGPAIISTGTSASTTRRTNHTQHTMAPPPASPDPSSLLPLSLFTALPDADLAAAARGELREITKMIRWCRGEEEEAGGPAQVSCSHHYASIDLLYR